LQDKLTELEELTLVPSDGGRFEIEVDGQQIWSKKKTKAFPETGFILQALAGKGSS